MCKICEKDYDVKEITCCRNVKEIPKTLKNLKELYCDNTRIKSIPETLINLELLFCNNTRIKSIPETLINLKELYCSHTSIVSIPETLINLNKLYCFHTQIKFIPETLTNLKILHWYNTQIKFIPETLINLKVLYCSDNILVSPQILKCEPNNSKYLTFTKCQKRIKLKLKLCRLKFAYDPLYIVGYNTKAQLKKLFKGPSF